MLPYFMSHVPIFLFLFFLKDKFSFILPNVNAQLVIDKPVTYIKKMFS